MFFKKIKSFIAITLIATFIMPLSTLAYSEYIIASGENIGLQLNSKGIIVAGFYKINDGYPGKEALLKKGDTIIKSDNKNVDTIDEFVNTIKDSNQRSLNITYIRNNKEMNTNLNLINEDGIVKTGLYIKDTITGIGTLTFIDPNTLKYGALGHEVSESQTGLMVDVKDGKIYNSKVTSIDKSIRGEPGSKSAVSDSNNVYGSISENTKFGVFGNYTKEVAKDKLYKVANPSEINIGKASIITVLKNDYKEEYDINILKINKDVNDNKNILFEVTDKKLIDKTGGIIQGMSGSPIIQDGNIVGAVNNVVVNEPTKGYGIFITSMLEEAEN